jgi:ERCC4-type nuclease
MKIKIDSREPPKIKTLMEKNGFKCEIEALPIGDFVYEDICIERKEVEDFVNSIRTGHLQKQLLQMQENYKRCYLIIIGNFDDLYFHPHIKQWTVEHTLGSLASINARYNVKVIQVKNNDHMAKIIKKIIEKSTDGKVPSLLNTELMTVKGKMTEEDTKLKMLMCIPQISYDRAQKLKKVVDIKLIKKDGSELQKRDILRVDGFGDILANNIIKINEVKKDEV